MTASPQETHNAEQDAPAGRAAAEALVVGGGAFAFYLATLVRTFGWGDSSELITAAYRLGIAHSPGYPLYVMLGKLFTLLPFGTVAERVNLMSACWGAVAVALVYLLGRQVGGSRRAGLVGAMAAAFGNTWWQQSTRAEVYSLHLALFAGALLALVTWRQSGQLGHLRLGGALAGLGLAHHPMMLLSLPGLAVLAATGKAKVTLRQVGPAAALLAGCAVLPYLYLLVRAPANPPPQVNVPATARGLAALILGSGNRGAIFAMGPGEIWSRTADFWGSLPWEVGWAVAILALVGLAGWWRRDKGMLGGWLLIVGASLLFALTYRIVDPQAYYLPVFLALCVAGAGGVGMVLRYCRRQSAWLSWPVGMVLLLAAASGAVWCVRLNLCDPVYEAEDFARGAFKAVAPGSLILADWWCIGPLGYLKYVEHQRPDLHLSVALSITDERRFAESTSARRLSAFPQVWAAEMLTNRVRRLREHYPISGSGPLYQVLVKPSYPIWESAGPVLTRFGRQRLHRVGLEHTAVQQGEALWLELAWSGPPAPGTTALVTLERGSKRLWRDAAPVAGSIRSSVWPEGKAAVDKRLVLIPTDCPPGRYRLRLLVRDGISHRLSRPFTLARVQVARRGEQP